MRGLVLGVLVVTTGQVRAECPTTPEDVVCRPWSALLLPTVYGGIYAPHQGDPFYGGGVELVWLAWSDNSQAFGPGQGRIRTDIGVLGSGAETAGTLVMYRTGAQVAFERNASRDYAIPYFAIDFGGLYSDATGRRWFMDGGVGLYVLHRRGMIVDAEVTGLLPFRNADQLGGVTSRLALSFALW